MMKQAQNSSIKPENIKPESVKPLSLDYVKAGRGQQPIDTTQIRQKPVIGSFEITATGDKNLHIGYVPSLIIIKAYEDGHSPNSEALVTADRIHCIYKDSGWNYAEATWQTVIYLSHAGTTSATLVSYWKITKINCASYNHDAICHWIAYP